MLRVQARYWVEYLPENPWIHQPFEVYDDLDPATLRARIDADGGNGVATDQDKACSAGPEAATPVGTAK